MRNFIPLLAVPFVAVSVITGCNNKPPFEKLVAAVDSVNTYYGEQPEMTAPDANLTYDKITNTVKFNYELPSQAAAEFYQDNIGVTEDIMLNDVLPEAPYSLLAAIVDAEANVMLAYDWKPDGHSEYLITADRVKEAYERFKDRSDTARPVR